MDSIVDELQRDALNGTVSLADLLRKVRVVASKLSLQEPLEWVNLELNGYPGDVPDYRMAVGQAKSMNGLGRWQPVVISDYEVQRMVCTQPLKEPVRTLEHFLTEEGNLAINLSGIQAQTLCELARYPVVPIRIFIDRGSVVRALDAVRTKVVDWSVALQEAGVRGEGISFSQREKSVAHTPSVVNNFGHVENLVGNAGGIVHGDVNATTTQTSGEKIAQVADLIRQIRAMESQMGMSPATLGEMTLHLGQLEKAIEEPQPKPGLVKGLLKAVGSVAQSVAGNVISAGVSTIANNIADSLTT